jgi:type IV pilus assembly protein PilC
MSIFKNIFNWLYLVIQSFFIAVIKGIKSVILFLYSIIKFLVKYIYIIVKFLVKLIYKIIKIMGVEVFHLLNYFIMGTYLFLSTIFKFLYIIFKFIFTYLFKILKYVGIFFYKVFKFIFIEVYRFFKSIALSIYSILKLFYFIPKFLINALSSFLYFVYNKIKKFITAFKIFIKEVPSKIKKYFVDKYNNLAIVKYYRNKKERELEILYIDKNSKDAVRSTQKQTYRYLARNKDGKLIKGYFAALSKLDTHSYLLDEGYEVYEIKTSKWINFIHGESQTIKRKMKGKDLIFWLTQLSTYVKSGIPLTDSIKILAQQDKRRKYKKVYDSIIYELTMGESFSKALEKQGSMFPGLLINMIAAAELIGDIESTLDEMAQYYSETEDTKKSIKSAMTYPVIVMVFAIIVLVFILIFIIPQFVDIYESAGVELNPITQFVLDASDFLQNNYFWLILGITVIITLHLIAYKNLKAYKTVVQYILMHFPIIGKLMIYKEMNLFAKTFASLNKNNVLLTESIDILSKITNNEIYKMIMYDTVSNLLRGDKMSKSFKDNWAVPDIAYYMITTGESTGELAAMLEKIAEYYQKQQKGTVQTLKAFIEPLMIAFLALIVGGIIVSVLIPMFSMYTAIQ